jgi:hypothetical protein
MSAYYPRDAKMNSHPATTWCKHRQKYPAVKQVDCCEFARQRNQGT